MYVLNARALACPQLQGDQDGARRASLEQVLTQVRECRSLLSKATTNQADNNAPAMVW
jgi:hypothetical protein